MAEVPKQLTPWKPGQSGNPNGRPATAHVRQEILRVFRERPEDVAAIVGAQIEQAKSGNTAAFKATVEWVEPALPKEIKVTTDFADKFEALCEASARFIPKDRYAEWHSEISSILRPSFDEATTQASVTTTGQS